MIRSDREAIPRVVVVGCGGWGRHHARNHAELGSLAGISDPRPETEQLAARYGVPARPFDEVLADPAVDGIVLAVPPVNNRRMGVAALEAGKHLFVEKPMALTVAEAEALCAAAETAGRILMVGHILRHHPAFAALLSLVREGRLGHLLRIVSTRFDFGRIRHEEDVLWDLAPHDVSMVLALAGTEPGSVAARGSVLLQPGIADAAALDLGFPGGLAAEIRVSWLHPFKEQRLVVIGEGGMAVFDDREPWERKLVVYGHRVVRRDGAAWAEKVDGVAESVDPGEPLRSEVRHFLRCIATGETPLTDGQEGLRVLRALERAGAAMAAVHGKSTIGGGSRPISA